MKGIKIEKCLPELKGTKEFRAFIIDKVYNNPFNVAGEKSRFRQLPNLSVSIWQSLHRA
jgi:hypothetical protein